MLNKEIDSYDSYLKELSAKMNLQIPIQTREKMLEYVELMIHWNRAYNFTSIKEPKQIIARHLMDSLSVLPYLHGEQIIDVGSGAGLPGIPLALMLPYSDFCLLDSNGKKARFLLHTIKQLKLNNVIVINKRVENYQPGYHFDTIITRAFSSIAGIITLTKHLCGKNGKFLSMKGIYPDAEIAEIPAEFIVSGAHELHVPDVEGKRTLICLELNKK